ncbi:MAG: hypothetical protein LBD99_01810 [Candidatus Margulisbacteria bacterium]|jgi:hypothetical protein|nr:hypothetical protein [Candidatus Margulisiibacteriota bacterium]
MPKKKRRARDEILLRHITTGKIGCGARRSKKDFSRPRTKRETKKIAGENLL